MSTVTLAAGNRPAFVQRFDAIRAKSRAVRLATAAATAAALLLIGLFALAAADHLFELPRPVRVAGLAALAAASAGLFATRALNAWRGTAPSRTAAVVEERFPELGQSVRTLVQYEDVAEAGRLGAAPSLAAALADHTARRAGPLPLESVVPVRRLAVAAAGAAAILLVLFALSVGSWEWRTALRRSLLDERPWTALSVAPGTATVKEGDSLPLGVSLEGRTEREVTLFWRAAGEKEWAERLLTADDVTEQAPQLARYEAILPRISDPVEYRVTAGDFSAGPFLVDVRRPLTIESVAVELIPPAYTGLSPRTEETGDITAIEGSRARFQIQLDRRPAKAEMAVAPLGTSDGSAPEALPFAIENNVLVAELDLTAPFDWSVRATSEDGMSVRENGWRVRIRRDGAPQVWFERPDESLEVHTLAEIMMAIKARDDFGLARSGVVFQVNNEQEHTLLLEEFPPQPTEDGRPTPQTRADLERKLPLEFFELTEKDSVTYYAFAEDNRPDSPHRVETDRRFIDIRPFRRVYRYRDMEPMSAMTGDQGLMTLGEIIRRERFVLNRTLRSEKQLAAGEAFDFGVVDRLAGTQAELAEAARRLAEFFVGEGIDGADLMFQAEGSMLAAADSLTAGKLDTASLQERDALRSLIEARNTLELFLLKNPEARARIAEADRQMSQKLRRAEDDKPRLIASELRRLARQESEVAQGLGMAKPGGKGQGVGGMNAATPNEEEPKNEEPAEAAATDESDQEPVESDEPMPGAGESKEPDDQPEDPAAAGEAKPDEPLSPEELEDLQAEIARRASEVAELMRGEEALTDLARARMEAAVQAADRAAGELSRGDSGAAAGTAAEASEMFSELARHVDGLLAGEPTRRIAEARDLAGELSERERRLAEELADGSGGQEEVEPSDESENEREDGAGDAEENAKEAERLARSGETLLDVLRSVAESEDPAAAETASRLEQTLNEERIGEAVEEMKRVAAQVRGGETDKARAEANELGDRLGATSRRLDRLYRSIVAPKIEELARLEARAAAIRERLEEVENRAEAVDWASDTAELLDELTEVSGLRSDDDLREVIAEGTWQPGESGRLVAPVAYRTGVRTVVEDLQARIQELLLADVLADGDAAVPTAYRELVDRYYQVLSSSAVRASGASAE